MGFFVGFLDGFRESSEAIILAEQHQQARCQVETQAL
jgi:hypothetical protein